MMSLQSIYVIHNSTQKNSYLPYTFCRDFVVYDKMAFCFFMDIFQ